MRLSLHISIAGRIRTKPLVCLLAVILLWAPLVAAALQFDTPSCCTAMMCSLHGHGRANVEGAKESASQTKAHMQCGFKGGVEQMNCSMSHCHDRGQTFMASVQFVLPIPPAALSPQRVAQLRAALDCVQVLHTFDPPTLPPRNSFL